MRVLETENRKKAAQEDRSLTQSTSRRGGLATLRSVRGRLVVQR
jgi:hypothetical protein